MLIFCDGGKRSGILYGSYKIFKDDATLLFHRQLVFGDGTSNEAEYLSLLSALRKAKTFGSDTVTVLTDSELVKRQLTGESACNAEHLKILKEIVEKEMENFESVTVKNVSRNIIKQHLGH